MLSLKDGLTRVEAAKEARCSTRSIDRAIKAGELDAYKPGAEVIIRPVDLADWIMNKKIKPVRSPGTRRRNVKVNYRRPSATTSL